MTKKAFILGAGLGTRLRPLTFIRPKPLLPVFGKPIILRAIQHLKSFGIKNIFVNTHHLPEKYSLILGNGKKHGVKITYSYEPVLLDTGGGLKNIERHLKDDTFIMYNGDIITDIDLNKMLSFHKEKGGLATLLISKKHDPLHVHMDNSNRITDIGAHLKYSDRTNLCAFCGIHIIEPEIFRYIPKNKPVSIIKIYQGLIKRGIPIFGYPLGNASWEEMGSSKKVGTVPTFLLKSRDCPYFFTTTPLLGGSQRKFTRISLDRESIICAEYSPDKEENTFYASILSFLKKLDINVPDIIFNDTKSNKLYLEDLGNRSLFSACKRKINLDLYKKTIDEIVKLHNNGMKLFGKKPFPISPAFNYKLYRWESGYFEENCIQNYFKITLDKKSTDLLHKDFHFLAKSLCEPPTCLMHRDFQSKNVMIKDNKPYLIDCQGLRLGLPFYDLASLLYDPYINIAEKDRYILYSYYLKKSGRKDRRNIFYYCAVQRIMQALGAYGFLGLKMKKIDFLSYIPQAVGNLDGVLKNIKGLDQLKKVVSTCHK